MTETERARTEETAFRLLDKPWEEYKNSALADYVLARSVGYEVWTYEDWIAEVNENTDENGLYYGTPKDEVIAQIEADHEAYHSIQGLVVNGSVYFAYNPPFNYDGGAGTTYAIHFNPATGEASNPVIEFRNYDDFKTKLRADLDEQVEGGMLDPENADNTYDDMVTLYDAVIDGTAVEFPRGTIDAYYDFIRNSESKLPTEDSYTWDFDEEAVAAIKDQIKEFHIYDEELDQYFVVHIVTPPDFDENESYPALVMTDAVWRFSDCTRLVESMKQGTTPKMITVTIGFEYNLDSWDNETRAVVLCDKKKEFLDFITDNLMPFVNEMYKLDTSKSVLFGHSQGGVFSHYAAFNYDRYENQPFAKYIIGSPAFWSPYFTCVDDYDDYMIEYGFFDRNDSYDKELFITGGDEEDVDYADYYGDNYTTLEGIEQLRHRLEKYGVTSFEVKLYHSHHYQYVSDMILEYVSRQ